MIRSPGKIPAGVISNEIIQHHDWLPTFLAAAGDPDIMEKLKAGYQVGDTTFKVHSGAPEGSSPVGAGERVGTCGSRSRRAWSSASRRRMPEPMTCTRRRRWCRRVSGEKRWGVSPDPPRSL